MLLQLRTAAVIAAAVWALGQLRRARPSGGERTTTSAAGTSSSVASTRVTDGSSTPGSDQVDRRTPASQ